MIVSDEEKNEAAAAVTMPLSNNGIDEDWKTLVLDARSYVWVPKKGSVVDKSHLTTIKTLAESAKGISCSVLY